MEGKALIYKMTRETGETKIGISIEKGTGPSSIDTGVGFLDHMLDLFAFHGHFILNCTVDGDVTVDDHHTVEDVGIVLGQLLSEMSADKAGITRYGHAYVPMDETLSRTVTDVSGRPYLSFGARFSTEKVGSFDTELVEEFFRALVINAKFTVHIDLIRGGNSHHEIESIFKSFAQSVRIALSPSQSGRVPSSKGVL
jgi:imidazoleglycerol-phosphate dehydratase